ncbi:MAG: hypothetical protein FWH10_08000 [Oscillospiraceae bacterium]|nr:hypothetical protein [Oscillospiraceae bacterium]
MRQSSEKGILGNILTDDRKTLMRRRKACIDIALKGKCGKCNSSYDSSDII